MAGTIVADTLSDGAGNTTSMDNAIYGSAKAWVNFVGTSGSINGSYNVSSVTRTNTGSYNIVFTTALSSTGYCVSVGISGNASNQPLSHTLNYTQSGAISQTISGFSLGAVLYNDASWQDPVMVCTSVFR
jgi:hypothetical protein